MIVANIGKYEIVAWNNQLECNCADFRFRKRECKHIRQWKSENDNWEKLAEEASLASEPDDFRQAKTDLFDY